MTEENVNIKGGRGEEGGENNMHGRLGKPPWPESPSGREPDPDSLSTKSSAPLPSTITTARAVWSIKRQVETALCAFKRHKQLSKKLLCISIASVRFERGCFTFSGRRVGIFPPVAPLCVFVVLCVVGTWLLRRRLIFTNNDVKTGSEEKQCFRNMV